MKKCIKTIALYVSIIIIISAFVGSIFLSTGVSCFFPYQTTPEFWAVFISSLVAIANSILLYLTLSSQNTGIRNEKDAHRQERFETTFFNLLNHQRQLTDEINVATFLFDDNCNIIPLKLCGRSFFSFAIAELHNITITLESNSRRKYDENETTNRIMAFEDKWNRIEQKKNDPIEKQKEWNEIYHATKKEYYNLIYNISEEDCENYNSDTNIPYKLFYKKWYSYYEHYIRSLYNNMSFIDTDSVFVEGKVKYWGIIQSQMTQAELDFIKIHVDAFPNVHKLLIITNFTDITIN